MKVLAYLIVVCLVLSILAVISGTATAQCRTKKSINYFAEWSEYYTACYSEMRTTFDWVASTPGAYRVVWCQVDNTPFSKEYWAGDLPGNSGSEVEGTHCTTSNNHRLMMDVLTEIHDRKGFNSATFTADYYEDTPY